MEIEKFELPAGEGQLIVIFLNKDTGVRFDISVYGKAVADDAAARRAEGWRLQSVASVHMKDTTTGGPWLDPSKEASTQAALMAVYTLE